LFINSETTDPQNALGSYPVWRWEYFQTIDGNPVEPGVIRLRVPVADAGKKFEFRCIDYAPTGDKKIQIYKTVLNFTAGKNPFSEGNTTITIRGERGERNVSVGGRPGRGFKLGTLTFANPLPPPNELIRFNVTISIVKADGVEMKFSTDPEMEITESTLPPVD